MQSINRSRFRRILAVAFALILLVGALPALADQSSTSKDPSFSKKWGSYTGGFPAIGVVTDCKRLNLRYEASTNGEIAHTVGKGTELTVLGFSGKFAQVSWNGNTYYAYGSYIAPVRPVTPTPVPTPRPTPAPWPPEPPVVYYECNRCGLVFRSYDALRWHIMRDHLYYWR